MWHSTLLELVVIVVSYIVDLIRFGSILEVIVFYIKEFVSGFEARCLVTSASLVLIACYDQVLFVFVVIVFVRRRLTLEVFGVGGIDFMEVLLRDGLGVSVSRFKGVLGTVVSAREVDVGLALVDFVEDVVFDVWVVEVGRLIVGSV